MVNRVGECPYCKKSILIVGERSQFSHYCVKQMTRYDHNNMPVDDLQNIMSVEEYSKQREARIAERRKRPSPTPVQLIDINIF